MAENRVKRDNYVTIAGWMVTDLGLKGNELLVYAIIYGFSQDGENRFTGSLQYLADWTNSTKQGIAKNLKSLCEKGLLEKTDIMKNGVKFCEYHVTMFNGVCNKVVQGMQQSLTGGIKQSLTNNIDLDIIDNNNRDNRESTRTRKHKYGEFQNVLLTDAELKKLQDKHSDWAEAIEHLSEYMERTGRKYKSHYLTLLNWVFDAVKEKKQKQSGGQQHKEYGQNGVPIRSKGERLSDLDDVF